MDIALTQTNGVWSFSLHASFFCIISRNWQKRRKKILQGCKKRKISLRKTSSAASEGRKRQEIYGFVQNGKSHWPKSASKEKKPLQNRD